jgi:hypothetical protein
VWRGWDAMLVGIIKHEKEEKLIDQINRSVLGGISGYMP